MCGAENRKFPISVQMQLYATATCVKRRLCESTFNVKYHCTADLQFNFCLYSAALLLLNYHQRNLFGWIETSLTGGQLYIDTSCYGEFSLLWLYDLGWLACVNEAANRCKSRKSWIGYFKSKKQCLSIVSILNSSVFIFLCRFRYQNYLFQFLNFGQINFRQTQQWTIL